MSYKCSMFTIPNDSLDDNCKAPMTKLASLYKILLIKRISTYQTAHIPSRHPESSLCASSWWTAECAMKQQKGGNRISVRASHWGQIRRVARWAVSAYCDGRTGQYLSPPPSDTHYWVCRVTYVQLIFTQGPGPSCLNCWPSITLFRPRPKCILRKKCIFGLNRFRPTIHFIYIYIFESKIYGLIAFYPFRPLAWKE